MEIRFKAVLTESTYARMVRFQMRGLKLMGWFSLVVGLLGLGSFIVGSEGSSLLNGGPNSSWGTMISIVLMIGLYLLWAPSNSARKGWKSNPGLQDPAEWTVNEDGVNVVSEFHTSHIPWSKFHHHVLDKDLLLLFTQENSAFLVLESYLSSAPEWEQLKKWSSTKVPQDPQHRSMLKAMLLWMVVLAMIFIALKFIPGE